MGVCKDARKGRRFAPRPAGIRAACECERSGAQVSESEIAGKLADAFASAWNRHDMDALAGLFFQDATFVNVAGTYLKGRDGIRRQHAAVHAGPFRNSVLRAEVADAREAAPGVIVAHVHTQLEGDDRFAGQTRRSLMTFVIERRSGSWWFADAQNTTIVPPPG